MKPANLLLNERDEVTVADFGIASSAGMDSMTLTGTVLGTAGYLSPEQAEGRRATPASDLYALAVVAYELLSGERPFERESPTAEAAAHVNAPVPSISARCKNLPHEIDQVFQRALAKDPGRRPGSAREFVAELRDALFRSAGATAGARSKPAATQAGARARADRAAAACRCDRSRCRGDRHFGRQLASAGRHSHGQRPGRNDHRPPDGHASDDRRSEAPAAAAHRRRQPWREAATP